MAQSSWDRIQNIYHAALALPEAQRVEFVAKECAGDPELLRQVISLLNAGNATVLKEPVFKFSSTDDLLGTEIDGRYVIERELCHGALSQVYVAFDLRLNREPVVIKILSKTLVQDSFARQHFDQEVEALLRIKDPAVVDVRDRGKLADGRPYIVMQYVHGETLRSQIRNEGMDLERAGSILKQVGAALERVHQKGIFHRDLKPENIMLRRDTGSVVLIDFGIAKVMDSVIASSTVGGASAGTLPYMSPEQLRGKRLTTASDIYSMGVVAYEMITGRRPFSSNSAAQLLDLQRERIRAKPVDLRPGLSKRAQRIIFRALSFDSKDRYQSAKQFGDDLAEALLNSERNGPKGLPIWRPFKKWLTVGGGVLIIALLSYGIYRYATRRIEPPPRNGFNYWLMVQRMRDAEEYGAAFKSNGNDTFENGDKFQLNVFSLEPGYLYIFNEGPPESGNISFRAIYPSQAINDNSASIGANHTVQSDWNTFRGPAGTDNFWIVWSASPITELESAKNEASKHPQAGLTDQNLVRVKEFLMSMKEELDVRTRRYQASQEVTVRSNSEIVLTLAQFKHR